MMANNWDEMSKEPETEFQYYCHEDGERSK